MGVLLKNPSVLLRDAANVHDTLDTLVNFHLKHVKHVKCARGADQCRQNRNTNGSTQGNAGGGWRRRALVQACHLPHPTLGRWRTEAEQFAEQLVAKAQEPCRAAAAAGRNSVSFVLLDQTAAATSNLHLCRLFAGGFKTTMGWCSTPAGSWGQPVRLVPGLKLEDALKYAKNNRPRKRIGTPKGSISQHPFWMGVGTLR